MSEAVDFAAETLSVSKVAQFFGGAHKRGLVQELVHWGKVAPGGLHPLRGGLAPTFKPSPRSRMIPRAAIERHLRHMERLQSEPAYAAAMRARARELALPGYGRGPAMEGVAA